MLKFDLTQLCNMVIYNLIALYHNECLGKGI